MAVLTLGLSISGLVTDGAGSFASTAFAVANPFAIEQSHEIKIHRQTRRRDRYQRYMPGMRDPYRLAITFLGDTSQGLPRIPEGKELTSVVVTLASGVTLGTGTGGTAIIHACQFSGSIDGRPIIAKYQMQFSGPVTPEFHDAFVSV